MEKPLRTPIVNWCDETLSATRQTVTADVGRSHRIMFVISRPRKDSRPTDRRSTVGVLAAVEVHIIRFSHQVSCAFASEWVHTCARTFYGGTSRCCTQSIGWHTRAAKTAFRFICRVSGASCRYRIIALSRPPDDKAACETRAGTRGDCEGGEEENRFPTPAPASLAVFPGLAPERRAWKWSELESIDQFSGSLSYNRCLLLSVALHSRAAASLALASMSRGAYREVPSDDVAGERGTDESPSFWSRLTFRWALRGLSHAHQKRPLEQDDLGHAAGQSKARNVAEALRVTWHGDVRTALARGTLRPRFWWSVFKATDGVGLLVCLVLVLCARILQPVFLFAVLQVVPWEGGDRVAWLCCAGAGLWAAVSLEAVMWDYFTYSAKTISVSVRTAVTGLFYNKVRSLRLTYESYGHTIK